MSDVPPTAVPPTEVPPMGDARESLWLRLLWMVIIGVLMGVAQMLTNIMALVQIILMAVNKGPHNAEIARFGTSLGLWLAKAARFQTAASEDKPWPWSPL